MAGDRGHGAWRGGGTHRGRDSRAAGHVTTGPSAESAAHRKRHPSPSLEGELTWANRPGLGDTSRQGARGPSSTRRESVLGRPVGFGGQWWLVSRCAAGVVFGGGQRHGETRTGGVDASVWPHQLPSSRRAGPYRTHDMLECLAGRGQLAVSGLGRGGCQGSLKQGHG